MVELSQKGDQLCTDLDAIKAVAEDPKYKDKILCVLSTTSCFAPRVYDDIVGIAKLCKDKSWGHVINSAYGL